MNKINGTESKSVPEPATIIEQKLCQTDVQEEGAAAFSGKLNHMNSRYYVFNDFYNMKSEEIVSVKEEMQKEFDSQFGNCIVNIIVGED